MASDPKAVKVKIVTCIGTYYYASPLICCCREPATQSVETGGTYFTQAQVPSIAKVVNRVSTLAEASFFALSLLLVRSATLGSIKTIDQITDPVDHFGTLTSRKHHPPAGALTR
jgi:hypothetical protein